MKKLISYINILRCLPVYVCFRLISNKKEIIDDLKRIGESASLIGISRATLRNTSCFRNLLFYRCCLEYPKLTRFSKIFLKPMFSLEIDVEDNIGGGMKIMHGYSTIVHAKSIGEHFTVYQNVTIGRGKSYDGNEIPIIGNNVTVYAGAMILGGVNIGDYATIGAGAVVVKDVPACSTVVSSPMRVLKKQE